MTAPKAPPPLSEANRLELERIRAVPYGLAGFRRFARLLVLTNGKPLKLAKFQTEILAAYFAGTVELVVIVPKKNGKTTLLAALALYHLFMTLRAECVIGASSRDQATVLFDQAKAIVEDSGLEAIFDVKSGYREMRHGKGRIKVMAADATTADGVIPTLALVDELHRHPSGALYGVFRDGLEGRDGRMVTISTAGTKIDSPLGELRTRAQALPTFKRTGTHSVATDKAAGFVLHEWGLTDEEDPEDIALVARANPAPWQTQARLRRRRHSPTMTIGQWLRFACGIWTEGDEPAIAAKDWDDLAGDIGHVEEGETVTVACHVGETAWIALVAPRDGERIAAKVLSLGEDRSGVKVEARLMKLGDRYQIQQVAHPRTTFMRSAEMLQAAGLPMEETPYSPQRIAVISATFNRLLNSGLLMHDGDPVLRAQVLAATSKETETGWRYVLSPRSAALITLANACHQATAFSPEPFIGTPTVVG